MVNGAQVGYRIGSGLPLLTGVQRSSHLSSQASSVNVTQAESALNTHGGSCSWLTSRFELAGTLDKHQAASPGTVVVTSLDI